MGRLQTSVLLPAEGLSESLGGITIGQPTSRRGGMYEQQDTDCIRRIRWSFISALTGVRCFSFGKTKVLHSVNLGE